MTYAYQVEKYGYLKFKNVFSCPNHGSTNTPERGK